jgi:hypothetical protein
LSQSGNFLFNGVIDQDINNNGLELYNVHVSKTAGVVNMNNTLPLSGTLLVQSATQVNTNGNLIIQSKGNTTDLDASIGPIAPGGLINGNVTVQRFMHPFGFSHNRYLSVPVLGASPSAQLADDFQIASGSIRYYREPVAGNANAGWTNWSLNTALPPGLGFIAWMYNGNAQITWDVSGTINQGSVVLPVSFTPVSGILYDGWNLVGNPYASAIHWSDDENQWTRSADISPTVYVTDMFNNEYQVFNFEDNSGEGGVIAMGQAFWVKANAPNPSLIIHEQAKTTSPDGAFYRTKSVSSSEQLIIALKKDGIRDKTYLKFNPEATEGFDHRFDAIKLKPEQFSVYLVDADELHLVMHTLPSLEASHTISIGIEAQEPGTYELSFSNAENFRYGKQLYLVDRKERRVLPVDDLQYTFTIHTTGVTDHSRFYLSLSPVLVETTLEESISVYPNPVTDFLTIQLPDNEKAVISIFDGKGSTVLLDIMQGSHELDFRDFPKGLYILKLQTAAGVVVKKIQK